ncbi:DUF4349 domain-containing protein [Streptomyces sp. cmx-18-6]|uniref:DUF4349 domain-containing protein n=1 Tax=Streptomyces sp. cmx-18-6 TaxID=2790930 RepID=UPI00397F5F17
MDSGTDRFLARPPRTAHRRRAGVRAALAAALGAMLLVGGCGAGADSMSDESAAQSRYENEEGGKADLAKEGFTGDAAAKTAEERKKAPKPGAAGAHVIRTTELSVEVGNVPKAAAAARASVEASGGLVATETTDRIDDEHEISHLVLRVPQDDYKEVLAKLTGSGKLISRSSNAKDVTDKVVDVESRIATQRASVARVRELMDKAEKLADVVTLEGELSSRQADLESLLAQQSSLKDRVSLATITLELSGPDAPREEGKDDPGFLDALGGGWDAFVTVFRWLAMAIGASAPFLATAALLVVLWRVLRARRTARNAPAAVRPKPEAEGTPAS